MSDAGLAALLDEHMPWARAEFRASRLWMACCCGWNAMGDSDGTWSAHLIAAGVALDHRPETLPFREIGYTAEECERDMRRLTNGERGCANPDEHLMSRFTGHMDARPAPDAALLRKMLPGVDALLVVDAEDAGRVISERPDVWVVLSAYLRAALEATDG